MNLASEDQGQNVPESQVVPVINISNQHTLTSVVTETTTNVNSQNQPPMRPGVEARIFANRNQGGQQTFPTYNSELRINRVTSKEYKERQSFNSNNLYNQTLTHSLYAKTNTQTGDGRGTDKLTSSNMGGNTYLNPRQIKQTIQSSNNKLSDGNRFNYKTYKKDPNDMAPRYANDKDSQNGSLEKQIPPYQRIQDLGITRNMVSSIISRQSQGKTGAYLTKSSQKQLSSKGKLSDQVVDEAYNLYSSRHPSQSIRKSTIEISKAISSNAITELERQNQTQIKTIETLQSEVQSLKGNLHKWQDEKHKYQMDIQTKTRQIFDIQRENKRLQEEVRNLRAYRTMQTVEQVIIAKLKQEIMSLNKKIIEIQAQYYRKQRLMMSKYGKDKDVTEDENNEKEIIKKLEANVQANKKQIELLGVELKNEKEKSWKLQRQRQQYLTEKQLVHDDYQRQLNQAKSDIVLLNQEVVKHMNTIRLKDNSIQQIKVQLTKQIQEKQKEASSKKVEQQLKKKLQEQKQAFDTQLAKQIKEKEITLVKKMEDQQQKKLSIELSKKLQEQKQAFDTQLTKQIKEKEVALIKKMEDQQQKKISIELSKKLQEQKQTFDTQLTKQIKEKEVTLVKKMEEEQQKKLSIELSKKEQEYKNRLNDQMKKYQIKIIEQGKEQKVKQNEAVNNLQIQIKNLKNKIEQNNNQIKKMSKDNQMVNTKMKQKNTELENLKIANLKSLEIAKKQSKAQKEAWAKQQAIRVQHVIRLKIQAQIKQRQKQLQQKAKKLQASQVKNQEIKVNLQKEKEQMNIKAAETQKQIQEKANNEKKEYQSKCQELQTKYNNITSEINMLKAEKMKLEQKLKQDQIQMKRTNDIINVWKMKAESVSAVEQERDQLRVVVKQLEEGKGAKNELLTKFQQLTRQNEILKKKLAEKDDEFLKNASIYSKIKGYYDVQQNKAIALSREIRALQSKVVETQAKFGAMLAKVQLEQFKYKELYNKLIADSQTYMSYIKKLQEENELVYQKYMKLRKHCRNSKVKLEEENDIHEKVDYSVFRQFLEKQVISQFTHIIIPSFESNVIQRIASFEANLVQKLNKIPDVKLLSERYKKRKQRTIST